MEDKNKAVVVKRDDEVVDAEVGAQKAVAPKQPQNFNNQFDMAELLSTAGQLEVTEEQRAILQKPLTPDEIEIRPDGLIYLPWVEYQTRLDKAFGTAWSMVPNGMPRYDQSTNQIIWGFYLVVKGLLVDFAVGGQEYRPTGGLNFTDAIEGCKSNALMRLCKRLSIGLDMWRPSFVRAWKEKYAESYQGTDWRGSKKTFWRKKANVTETKETK